MIFTSILNIILTFLVGLVAYFLRDAMTRLKDVELVSEKNESDIKLINLSAELKNTYFTEKFEDLKESLTNLTQEIKDLNKTISSK